MTTDQARPGVDVTDLHAMLKCLLKSNDQDIFAFEQSGATDAVDALCRNNVLLQEIVDRIEVQVGPDPLKDEFDRLGVRDEVLAFAIQMEHLLRENEAKGGWRGMPLPSLLEKLKAEVKELEDAIKHSGGGIATCREAGDVGNFALMIFDVSLGYDTWHRQMVRNLATLSEDACRAAWDRTMGIR